MTTKSYLKFVLIGSLLFVAIFTVCSRFLLSPSEDIEVPVELELALDDSSDIHGRYELYLEKCRIRKYDPNDPETLEKYFTEEVTECPTDAKPFVFYPEINATAGRSCVGIDRDAASESYGGEVERWNCIFRGVARDWSKDPVDRNFHLGSPLKLKAGDCPSEEFIWIECGRPGQSKNYQQPLMLPVVKPAREPMKANNRGRKPLNVLVLGLDAVSRLMIHRQLPRTVEFLKTKENLVELFGYNKIEDNSRPNQLPLLTGTPFVARGLSMRVGQNYYDNLTRIIWDDYNDRGYRTMFYEEETMFGLFDHPVAAARGFVRVSRVALLSCHEHAPHHAFHSHAITCEFLFRLLQLTIRVR